jgi:gamma-glutamylputrescine oxidase
MTDAPLDSYYAACRGSVPAHAPLDGDLETEVCVVGAGLTGVSCACELAERGVGVAVLEARRLGWGASGRNGGQAQLGVSPGMAPVERMLGMADARRLWDLTVQGLHAMVARIGRLGIACDLGRGYLLAVTKPRNLRGLAAWAEAARREYGFDGYRLLDRDEVRREVASERYHGGLLDPVSRHLDPLAYLTGLAEAARASGALMFEGSPALRIESGDRVAVHTGRGCVRAKALVLAGNAYLGGLAPVLAPRVMPVAATACATAPLGEARARALIPNGVSVCDDRQVLDYYRVTGDHRLLFGGGAGYSGRAPRGVAARMRRRVLRVFPQLAGADIAHAWSGRVAITRNRLPDIGRLAANVYYAQGFSGQGLVLTGVAGRAIAEAITGAPNDFDLLARIRHAPFPGGRALRMPLLVAGQAWMRLKDML